MYRSEFLLTQANSNARYLVVAVISTTETCGQNEAQGGHPWSVADAAEPTTTLSARFSEVITVVRVGKSVNRAILVPKLQGQYQGRALYWHPELTARGMQVWATVITIWL